MTLDDAFRKMAERGQTPLSPPIVPPVTAAPAPPSPMPKTESLPPPPQPRREAAADDADGSVLVPNALKSDSGAVSSRAGSSSTRRLNTHIQGLIDEARRKAATSAGDTTIISVGGDMESASFPQAGVAREPSSDTPDVIPAMVGKAATGGADADNPFADVSNVAAAPVDEVDSGELKDLPGDLLDLLGLNTADAPKAENSELPAPAPAEPEPEPEPDDPAAESPAPAPIPPLATGDIDNIDHFADIIGTMAGSPGESKELVGRFLAEVPEKNATVVPAPGLAPLESDWLDKLLDAPDGKDGATGQFAPATPPEPERESEKEAEKKIYNGIEKETEKTEARNPPSDVVPLPASISREAPDIPPAFRPLDTREIDAILGENDPELLRDQGRETPPPRGIPEPAAPEGKSSTVPFIGDGMGAMLSYEGAPAPRDSAARDIDSASARPAKSPTTSARPPALVVSLDDLLDGDPAGAADHAPAEAPAPGGAGPATEESFVMPAPDALLREISLKVGGDQPGGLRLSEFGRDTQFTYPVAPRDGEAPADESSGEAAAADAAVSSDPASTNAMPPALERPDGLRFNNVRNYPRLAYAPVAPGGVLAESYRRLRGRVLALPGARKSLLLCGSARGVGCTEVALQLALQLAKRPEARVCLADCNFRHPALAARLGIPVRTFGVGDLLRNACPLEDALVYSGEDNLFILPARAPVGDGDDLLDSGNAVHLLERLHRAFEYVVVDAGLAGRDTGPGLLAPVAGSVAIVARAGRGSPSEVRAAAREISRAGGRVAGMVAVGAAPE